MTDFSQVRETLNQIHAQLAQIGKTLTDIAAVLVTVPALPVTPKIDTPPTPEPTTGLRQTEPNLTQVLVKVPSLPAPTKADTGQNVTVTGRPGATPVEQPPARESPEQTATKPADLADVLVKVPSLPAPTKTDKDETAEPDQLGTLAQTGVTVEPPILQGEQVKQVLADLADIKKYLVSIDDHVAGKGEQKVPGRPEKQPKEKKEQPKEGGVLSNLKHIVTNAVSFVTRIAKGESFSLPEVAAKGAEAVQKVHHAATRVGQSLVKKGAGKLAAPPSLPKPGGGSATAEAGEAVAGEGAAGEAAAGEGAAAVGEGAAEAGSALGSVAGAALAAVAAILAVVAAVVALVAAFVALPFALESFGQGLLDSQKKLAQVSGGMASVFARKEVFETMRDMRVGEATAGSAANLEGALENMSNVLTPIKAAVTNVVNNLLAKLVNLVATAVPKVLEALKAIIHLLGKMPGIGETMDGVEKGIQDILDEMREPPKPTTGEFDEWFNNINNAATGLTPARGWNF